MRLRFQTGAVALFLLLAAAGWALTLVGALHVLNSGWQGALDNGGDLPAQQVIAAIAGGSSIATAYRGDPWNPYPLPYEFALAPLGFLHGYVARAATTLACAVLMVAALRPFVDRRLALIPLITSAPVAGLIAIPHVMSVISLAGISLAAVAASRGRWWLLGFGLFVATMRPPNALPVVVAALIFAARARGALPRVIGGAALPALVLAVPAFLVDPGWIGDYLDNDRATMLAGLPLLVRQAGGTPGLIALAIVPAVVTAAIALRGGGQRDVFAAGAALGVLGSKLSGLYSGIFVLPALGATGRDPKLGLAPWVASAATWVVVIATSTSVLRGAEFPAQLVGLVYLLVVACFPLAIRGGAGPGKDASTGGPVYVPVDY